MGTFCDAIIGLGNAQIGAALLRHCTGVCKVTHLLRSLPPNLLDTFPRHVDHLIITTFQSLAGIPLSPAMITQLQLPVRFGGFGYLSAEVTSPSLYASATLAYAVHGAASIGARGWEWQL